MVDEMPSWFPVRNQLGSLALTTARGVVRFVGADLGEPDELHEPSPRTYRFWLEIDRSDPSTFRYFPPEYWRIADETGPVVIHGPTWSFGVDEEGRLQRVPASNWRGLFGRSDPMELLGFGHTREGRFQNESDDFALPQGDATPSVVAGRDCWRFVLAPPAVKSYALEIDVDRATHAILRRALVGTEWSLEALEFEVDVPIDPSIFEWEGPFATDWQAENDELDAEQAWFENNAWPTPRWWPGVHESDLEWEPLNAESSTGAFTADLLIGDATIARSPIGSEPPGTGWPGRSHERQIHRWVTGPWQWQLAVSEPLSDDDLARVIASMPDD